jgi:hypothetical protein
LAGIGDFPRKAFEQGGFAAAIVPDHGNEARAGHGKKKVADQNTVFITRNQVFYLNRRRNKHSLALGKSKGFARRHA